MDRWAVAFLVGLVAVSAGCAGIGPAGPVGDGPDPSGADVPAERVHTVSVVEVVDGDTMEVRYRNGTTDTVRLLGVDTPEISAEPQPAEYEEVPDTREGREWLREWGHRAGEFARAELAGAEVRIVVDARADVRGSYGRLLVYLHQDGELFNRALLEQGYARMYEAQFSRRGNFSDVEAQARSGDVGLWGFDDGTAGREGGRVGRLPAALLGCEGRSEPSQASSGSVVRSSADSIFDSAFRRCSSTVEGAQPSTSARSPWLTSRGMS